MKSQVVKKTAKRATQKERDRVRAIGIERTELAAVNEALRANQESLRQLSGRLLKLQDEERRRIARDLHDITGQRLAVQSMELSQLLNGKGATPDPETRRLLSDCDMLNKQVGEDLRTLSYQLYPPLLDELGLSSAVKWHVERFEVRTGIRVTVEINPDLMRLPPEVEMALFRIIQESLTNVRCYSGSTKAFVRVTAAANQVEVKIGDFGKGIEGEALNSTNGISALLGLGIQAMNARVRRLDGKLEIRSRSNEGTVVSATLPLPTGLATDAQKSTKVRQPKTTRIE